MSKRYQFKTTAEDKVVLSGSVWNKVAWVLNWIQGISVAGPLQMSDTPGGPLFALRGTAGGGFHVSVSAALTKRSFYSGYLIDYDTTTVDTSVITAATLGTNGEAIAVYNTIDDEIGSGHMLTDGGANVSIYAATRWLPRTTTDGLRIAVISAVDYKICPP